MPTLTLPIKVYNDSQLKLVEKDLKNRLKGLKVETEIQGATSRGWVQIVISGEDEAVASRLLAHDIGVCPVHIEHTQKFSTIKGRVVASSKSKGELFVDIGVFSPNIVDATISLRHLQAQLVDGRKVALEKFVELFGFRENLPLIVKILGTDKEKSRIEAMLSEKQLIQYRNWTQSLLDRLIVIGSSAYETRLALKRSGLNRDVIDMETLGLFEHAVVCKLGTDATGLISKIGRSLKRATFAVLSPKEMLEFLGYKALFTF